MGSIRYALCHQHEPLELAARPPRLRGHLRVTVNRDRPLFTANPLTSSRIKLTSVSLSLSFVWGCASPVIVQHDKIAIGLYQLQDRRLNPYTAYARSKGVGLLIDFHGAVHLGYSDFQTVFVSRSDKANFHLSTPLAEIMVGDAALDGIKTITEPYASRKD